MPVDIAQPLPQGRRPDWTLPAILDLRISRIAYEAPKHRHFTSALAGFREAIAFDIRTDGPIPARALGPALFIGEATVMECQRLADDRYRFLAFDERALPAAAEIRFGWMDAPADERVPTRFAYERPDG